MGSCQTSDMVDHTPLLYGSLSLLVVKVKNVTGCDADDDFTQWETPFLMLSIHNNPCGLIKTK